MKKRLGFLRWTPFDLPLALFLATGGVGMLVAYDRATAVAKLAMLAAAVAVYYGVAWQPQRNLWRLAEVWVVVGAGLAGYFLLTYDWQKWPADFGWLTSLGDRWMSVRPTLPGFISPNVTGGLLAMAAPLAVAVEVYAWRERRLKLLFINILLLGLILLGLLLTSSRGAWAALAVALAVALGLWGSWGLLGHFERWRRWRRVAVLGGLLLIAGLAAVAAVLYPSGAVALLNHIPGAQDAASRVAMAQGAWRLVGDFPFTGGGLGTFSGLYSTYILGILVPLFTYSHNLFLDVAVEQGWFGLLALAAVLGGSAWVVLPGAPPGSSAKHTDLLRWAVLASLIAICLHGLVDDTLYGNGGTPLLFVTAGMAVAVTQSTFRPTPAAEPVQKRPRWLWPAVGGAGVIALAVLFVVRQPLLATVYANMGAVQLSRLELAGWPDNRPNLQPSDVAAATKLFEQAVALDPNNRPAQQRLGRLALHQQDFAAAVAHLETAYQADPQHRGVCKDLGYAYVWQGQPDRAKGLLQAIPEAADELGSYAWWWGTQGRPDLAERATLMAKRLVMGN